MWMTTRPPDTAGQSEPPLGAPTRSSDDPVRLLAPNKGLVDIPQPFGELFLDLGIGESPEPAMHPLDGFADDPHGVVNVLARANHLSVMTQAGANERIHLGHRISDHEQRMSRNRPDLHLGPRLTGSFSVAKEDHHQVSLVRILPTKTVNDFDRFRLKGLHVDPSRQKLDPRQRPHLTNKPTNVFLGEQTLNVLYQRYNQINTQFFTTFSFC